MLPCCLELVTDHGQRIRTEGLAYPRLCRSIRLDMNAVRIRSEYSDKEPQERGLASATLGSDRDLRPELDKVQDRRACDPSENDPRVNLAPRPFETTKSEEE